MTDKPRSTQDGYNRSSPLNEGYVRKGGQNPPPQNLNRPPPPPAFRPAPAPSAVPQSPQPPKREG